MIIWREKLFQANQFKPLQERKNIETNKLLMIEGLETQLKLEEYERPQRYSAKPILMENVLDELINTLNTYGNDKIKSRINLFSK